MGFFGWFKKNTKSSEEEKKKVYIDGDFLFYEDHGYEEKVDLNQLRYAYVQILGDRPFLFLFDFQQRYIEVNQEGFSDVYKQISDRFGFNNDLFKKVVRENIEDTKKRIWIKPKKKNYRILEEDFNDFEDGFEVLSDPPQFISWDTTYEELFRLNVGETYIGSFEMEYFKFGAPVRIGKLVVNEFECITSNERKDIAIQSYFSTVYDESLTDKSYNELRALWKRETNVTEEDLAAQDHERDDQKHLNFYFKEMGLSIFYNYDTDYGYDDGGTSISITNYRDYDELLENEEYNSVIELSQIIELSEFFEINEDYRKNEHVKYIPSVIQQNYPQNSIIWLDKKNDVVGFSGEDKALIYPLSKVDSLVIQNVLPARGPGYSYIELVLKDQSRITITYGDQNQFDAYTQLLKNKIGLTTRVPEPFYNC